MNRESLWNQVLQFLAAAVEEDPSLGSAVRSARTKLDRERDSGKLPPGRCWVEEDGSLTLEWLWGEDRRIISIGPDLIAEAEFKAGNLSAHSRQHISEESVSGR